MSYQQGQFEEQKWGSSGRSRFPNGGHASGGVADTIGGMFDQDRKHSLPMYKDKPYQYPGSQRRLPWFRKKRLFAAIALSVLALFYWLGIFTSGIETTTAAKALGKPSSGWFDSSSGKVDWEERREAVKQAFRDSWAGYEKYAWGYDEYKPDSKNGRQMVNNGMGWIIVDALDTMMLMNLTKEVAHAREWISTTLSYDVDHDVSTFETTIRMLGGLLTAHYMSMAYPTYAPVADQLGDDLYLERATDLADRLLGAYESKSGVPFASVNLHTHKGIPSHDDGGASSTAEATSLQLEMKYMSKLTGETHYWEAAEKVMQVVDDNWAKDGLLPIFINANDGQFRGSNIRLGSRGDSYYGQYHPAARNAHTNVRTEYLIKQYLQTSQQEPIYREMWDETLAAIQKHLITYSSPSNLTILAERPSGLDGALMPKMDHLVCFMPGTIAMATTNGKTLEEARKSPSWGSKQEAEMELARQLTKTCWGMYKVTATGLAPEIAYFHVHEPHMMMKDGILQSPNTLSDDPDADWRKDYDIHHQDVHNLQRPETVETLFYMWRVTGDEMYRQWGWEMFEAFVKHTKVSGDAGYSSIKNVNEVPTSSRDNMESFWLVSHSQKAKYIYKPNH